MPDFKNLYKQYIENLPNLDTVSLVNFLRYFKEHMTITYDDRNSLIQLYKEKGPNTLKKGIKQDLMKPT